MIGCETAPLLVIRPAGPASPRLDVALQAALAGRNCQVVDHASEMEVFHGRRVLFAVALGKSGVNLEWCALLAWMRTHPGCLDGCLGAVLVDGESELYTKAVSRELVLAANLCGCAFIGAPLVESTRTLKNYAVRAANLGTDEYHAYLARAGTLVERLMNFELPARAKPKLVVLHASSHSNSNTYVLWKKVRELLPEFEVTEIGLRNGAVVDCSGCPYRMCLHFGEQGSCFYGGLMVEEVYPAVKAADGVVMLCPNYNDAMSANLTAFVNRLTALYRTQSFQEKALFGLVVSGYSGSDLVAQQLIAALNMNKGFYLPPRFTMLETANNAGEVLGLPGIDGRAAEFAAGIRAVFGDE